MKYWLSFLFSLMLIAPALADCTTPSGFKRMGSGSWRMANVGYVSTPGLERLPSVVPVDIPVGVRDLARMPSGRAAHIRTNASQLRLCYENAPGGSSTHKWVQDGMRGGDVFYRDYGTTDWKWLTTVHATDPNNFEMTYDMGSSADREFMVYFPIYTRLYLLRIEVPSAASFTPGPTPAELPLVFLGTSITQGANASRPGLAFVAQVGRALDRDAINLGWSGSCKLYDGFADLLDDIAASAYVIDCFQNMNMTDITSRMFDFGDDLAAAVYPAPVIFFEQAYDQRGMGPGNTDRAAETAAAYAIYEDLALIHDNVFWVSTDGMLGTDGAATSDGIHPNDLGHARMAEFYTSAIAPLL